MFFAIRRTAAVCAATLTLVSAALLAGCASSAARIEGTVEADIVSHYAETQGKLLAAPFDLGQPVRAGDVLAVLDTRQEAFALEQLHAALSYRTAAMEELLAGADDAQRAEVRNAVGLAQEARDTARLTLEEAQRDVESARTMRENGALSDREFEGLVYRADLARSALDTANLRLDSARLQYQGLVDGASANRIAMAAADIAQTESQIRQSEDRIARGMIAALADGIVVGKYYSAGDVVSPGSNLADIAGAGKYVAAYWPADRLALLEYGREMRIETASGTPYTGTLAYIDAGAVYTPREEQTAANRNKTAFKIKIRLAEDSPLKPGETVRVAL
ncbi:MAG: HlyD family efflux transporter periplasmic adaptor subunit [Clostridiales Family XIII bacterium]|jgi:HlyD family secretion protein|nr:HlyD family efflux transporter periplasmic adaptor subunit [Clostridiales Family XIII bacterium]